MPTLDPRVDAYLRTAPEFARPVLRLARAIEWIGAGKSSNWKYERP